MTTCSAPPRPWVPEGASFRSQDYDRERIGIASAFQWKNSDDSMRATLQFLRTDATTKWTETGAEIATDIGGQSTQGAGQGEGPGDLEFALVDGYDAGYHQVGSANMFTHGVITTDAGWSDDQRHDDWGSDWDATGRDGRTPHWGLPSNNLLRGVDQEYMTQDVGLNFKWDISENWGANFDAQYVKSTVTNLDMSLWTANFQNVSIDLRGDLPKVNFISPLQNENGDALGTCAPNATLNWPYDCTGYMGPGHTNTYDMYNNYWRAAMDHAEDSDGDEKALKFDIDRNFQEAGILKSLRFGARWSEREQDIRSTTWNWGALAETWGGRGPVWLDEGIDGVPNANGLSGYNGVVTGAYTYVDNFSNFMRGDSPTPTPVRLYNGSLTGSGYDQVSALAVTIGEEWRPYADPSCAPCHWVPLKDRPGVIEGTRFLPNEINTTDETVSSAYAMIRFGSAEDSDGLQWSGNLGVRWVRTDFTALGSATAPKFGAFGNEANCHPPATVPAEAPPWVPPAFCQAYPDADQRAKLYAFANGASVDYNADTSYDNWLPSLNVKVNLTDQFLVRFGFSQAMARPDLGLTRNYFNLVVADEADLDGDGDEDFTGLRADTGNGYLKPITSTQFDLSGEWYFSRVGQLSLSLFYKELKDVWTNGFYTTDLEIKSSETDTNPAIMPVTVVSPINSDKKGTMKGFELAYQQFYDQLPGFWSGFGIGANYTYIESDGVPQAILDPNGTGGTANNGAKVDTDFLPLTNLSRDNVNFQLMYNKGPLDARVAYSWRSRYLLTIRDVITPFSPIFNEATGQLDASFMYSLNDNVKLGIQAINLTNEVVKTSQVLEADADHTLTGGRSWFMSDRRVSAIVRVNF